MRSRGGWPGGREKMDDRHKAWSIDNYVLGKTLGIGSFGKVKRKCIPLIQPPARPLSPSHVGFPPFPARHKTRSSMQPILQWDHHWPRTPSSTACTLGNVPHEHVGMPMASPGSASLLPRPAARHAQRRFPMMQCCATVWHAGKGVAGQVQVVNDTSPCARSCRTQGDEYKGGDQGTEQEEGPGCESLLVPRHPSFSRKHLGRWGSLAVFFDLEGGEFAQGLTRSSPWPYGTQLDMNDKVWREINVLKLFSHPHIIRLYVPSPPLTPPCVSSPPTLQRTLPARLSSPHYHLYL